MNCKNCGFQLSDGDKTCPNCGTINDLDIIPMQNGVIEDPEIIGAETNTESETLEPVPNPESEILESESNTDTKKTNKTKIIVLIVVGLIIIVVAVLLIIKFLGVSQSTVISGKCGKSRLDYFMIKEVSNEKVLWKLSNAGARQENLVIPADVDKFLGTHLTKGTSVKNVCFESDNNIDIGRAFNDSENLETIMLPENFNYSFTINNCPKLKEITIPEGVEIIASSAFYKDTSLKKVVFRGNVREIQTSAFYGCKSLKSIELPDTVEKIYDDAFSGCTSLKTLTLPKGLKHLNSNIIFKNTGLNTIIVPKEVELEYWDKKTTIKIPGCTIKVYKDSWMDIHFYEVFAKDMKKEYMN